MQIEAADWQKGSRCPVEEAGEDCRLHGSSLANHEVPMKTIQWSFGRRSGRAAAGVLANAVAEAAGWNIRHNVGILNRKDVNIIAPALHSAISVVRIGYVELNVPILLSEITQTGQKLIRSDFTCAVTSGPVPYHRDVPVPAPVESMACHQICATKFLQTSPVPKKTRSESVS